MKSRDQGGTTRGCSRHFQVGRTGNAPELGDRRCRGFTQRQRPFRVLGDSFGMVRFRPI